MDRYEIAKAARNRARARFDDSLAQAKSRLKPAALFKGGVETARNRIRDKPKAAAGIAAAIVMLILRKPIYHALRRAFKEKSK